MTPGTFYGLQRRCLRKKGFLTELAAQQTINRMKRQGLSCGTMRAYDCENCGRWHIGNVGSSHSQFIRLMVQQGVKRLK